jgi:putative tryptophan/tyrosine transport system substrate-binding protein
MRRREFIAGGLGTAMLPVWARAQQPPIPVIGVLGASSPERGTFGVVAFRKGLSEAGYIEGQNVAIEYRYALNDSSRLPALAIDLVRRQVAVIATIASTEAIFAAKAATATIPIVFSTGQDPVHLGIVASLHRPGGNVTGATSMSTELGAKRLELLLELVPGAARFALLVNPSSPNAEVSARDAQAAVSAIGRQIDIVAASNDDEIVAAYASLAQRRVDALLVSPDALFTNRRAQLVAQALRHSLPAIYPFRAIAEAGGLMSYGSSGSDGPRQAGIYAGRILNGEKPADLPVMQATKFEFVINLKTAKALGLTIPETLLATADEVIQ